MESENTTIGGVEKKTMLMGLAIVIVIILVLLGIYYWSKKSATTSSGSGSGSSSSQPTSQAFPDGSVLRCEATGAIYRVEAGMLRHFDWNGYVAAGQPQFTHVDCGTLASMPQGADITA